MLNKIALFLLIVSSSIAINGAILVSADDTPEHTAQQIAQCGADGGVWGPDTFTCDTTDAVSGGAPLSSSGCEDFNKSVLGIPTWYKYLGANADCEPIIGGIGGLLPIGLAVLEGGMTLGGMVAVVMVFIGGFKYVLSQGEPDKAAGGRKTVVNAMIGLVIVILATRIVSFMGNRLG